MRTECSTTFRICLCHLMHHLVPPRSRAASWWVSCFPPISVHGWTFWVPLLFLFLYALPDFLSPSAWPRSDVSGLFVSAKPTVSSSSPIPGTFHPRTLSVFIPMIWFTDLLPFSCPMAFCLLRTGVPFPPARTPPALQYLSSLRKWRTPH